MCHISAVQLSLSFHLTILPFFHINQNSKMEFTFPKPYIIYRAPFLQTTARIPGTNPRWKKRPSVVNPLSMLYIVQGTIRAKNKKNRLGNLAFIA